MIAVDPRCPDAETFPFRAAVRTLFENARHKAFLFSVEGALFAEGGEEPAGCSEEMRALIGDLAKASAGAVAVLAERPLGELDRCLAPLVLPGCGAGGLEIRSSNGTTTRLRCDGDLDPVRRFLGRPEALPDGVEIHDAGSAIEIRHGDDPERTASARGLARDAVGLAPAVFTARMGPTSARIGFSGVSRGRALHRLMTDAFFIERVPIVFGGGRDDDELYGAVRCFGGTSIEVGDRTGHGADLALPALNDVRWLMRDFLAELGGA